MLPGLGWSISDVVLVMSKLLEVYNAFHDGPHNAAKEVQELADELLRFRASLQRLRAVLEHHGQENVDSSDHHDDMSLKEVSVPISEKAPGLQRSPTSSSTLVHYSQKDLDADVKHCLEVIEECAAFIKRYTIITDANAEGKWNKIKRAARVVTWTTEDAVVEGLRRSLKSHLDHIDTSVSLTVASMTLYG